MSENGAITRPKLLIVEGRDEVYLFGKLISDLDLDNQIAVKEMKGKDNLSARLEVLLRKNPGHELITSVGIVQDADCDPSQAFNKICEALDRVGLPRPRVPMEPIGSAPKVAVLIVPDASSQGMLEDLCLRSVEQDPAMTCVDQFFQCLENHLSELPNNIAKSRVRMFLTSREWIEEADYQRIQRSIDTSQPVPPETPSTAQIHAFLASRYKPSLHLGIAAEAGYWNLDHVAFDSAKRFLSLL